MHTLFTFLGLLSYHKQNQENSLKNVKSMNYNDLSKSFRHFGITPHSLEYLVRVKDK